MKRYLITAIVILAMISLIAPATYATPTLQLTDVVTSTVVTIADQSVGQDLDSRPGVVSYVGQVGGGAWDVYVTVGVTKPEIGTATEPSMDIVSLEASSAIGGTLNIKFSEVGYGPVPGGFAAAIGGTTVGSVTYDTFYDPANGLFAEIQPITSQGPLGPAGFGDNAFANVGPIAWPFSLTQDVTVVHTGSGQTSFNASLTVPEPSSALLFLGLLLFGIGLLKKKKEI